MPGLYSQFVLAIDLGTSGPKVALATLTGEVIDAAIGSTPVILLPDGGVEQDPRDWWEAIKVATRQLLERQTTLRDRIVAVSCTTQWPTCRNL